MTRIQAAMDRCNVHCSGSGLQWVVAGLPWSIAAGFGSLHRNNGALQPNNGALQLVFDDESTRYAVVPGCNEK
jgi:hypothetical protein